MPVSTTWSVTDMTHMDSDGGVIKVRWSCVSQNDGGGETAMTGDKYTCTYDASSPDFTPYADLTENQVLGWVWDDMGAEKKSEIEATLVQKVDAQIQRNATESDGLPWDPADEPLEP